MKGADFETLIIPNLFVSLQLLNIKVEHQLTSLGVTASQWQGVFSKMFSSWWKLDPFVMDSHSLCLQAWGFFPSAGACWKLWLLKCYDVTVDLIITCSDLCSGGGREYQRKSPSILLGNFVSLTWMGLGLCSALQDYAASILFWLPKQEQHVTPHHSVCVQSALLLCCVQLARRVRI